MFQIKEITKLKKKMLNYLSKLKRSCNGDLSLEIDIYIANLFMSKINYFRY